MEWLVYVLVGCVSGFLAGLLGGGGGTLLVPALMNTLPNEGVGGPELVKICVATSMAIIIPTAIASTQAHSDRKGVDFNVLSRLAPGVMLGAACGALVAARVDALLVTAVFVAFTARAAFGMIWGAKGAAAKAHAPLPGVISLSARGWAIGVLSCLVGIGGSALVTPLVARHIPMARAVGTAAVIGLPLSIAAVIGYALAATPAGCSHGCAGYVFLPAVGSIGVAAVLTAPLGARMAHALPVAVLRRIFGLTLLVVLSSMVAKTLSPAAIAQVQAKAHDLVIDLVNDLVVAWAPEEGETNETPAATVVASAKKTDRLLPPPREPLTAMMIRLSVAGAAPAASGDKPWRPLSALSAHSAQGFESQYVPGSAIKLLYILNGEAKS